ncbi:MAG: PD40 domain-containing protein [Bacteroidetes bacterium]|nr:PD40 domain-containing protein [Bacteroidota bacterium]
MHFSKYFFVALFVLALVSFASAQTIDSKKEFDEAELLFNLENYEKALSHYLKVDSLRKNNPSINYKIGICYLKSAIQKEKAIKFLELAAQQASAKYQGVYLDNSAPLDAHFYLGLAYHINYQFDDAVSSLEKYKNLVGKTDGLKLKEIDSRIQQAKNGKELVAIPIPIKVENIGRTINSSADDYSPVFNADESMLIYTSRRSGSTGNKVDKSGKYHEDIYVSYKTNDGWSTPLSIGSRINSDGNEATVALSADGQKLIIYKDDNGDGNLYTCNLEGNTWSTPKKMNDFINSPYWESSASISADGNVLYFSSNRPGGLGGKDIYRSKKLPNGEWGRPTNLGAAVNTAEDDDAPFIHPDGFTLFYSSKGHKTIGGYDIFFTSAISDTGGWAESFNMGYPVNTTEDDLFFVPTVGNNRAYYASYKKDGMGEKDIYMITFTGAKEIPLTVYKGMVTDATGKVPDGLVISISDTKTNDIVGDYTPNSSTGKYLFILTPGNSYQISYLINGDEVLSETLKVEESTSYSILNKAIDLKPVVLSVKK